MPVDRHTQRVTLLLVAISAALVQVALDRLQPGVGVGLLGVSAGLAVGLAVVARRAGWTRWNAAATASVVALALLPIAWDAVSRVAVRVGAPYEVQLAYVLRNAMFGLAAASWLPRATPYATLASFFLVIFGFLWATGPLAITLLVAYAIIGVWWLLAAYWDRLGGRFADSSERAVPLRPALAAFAALGLATIACLPIVSRTTTTTALDGFFPSSGGVDKTDPFALGGVGDGDQMVAAKDEASSFGPIDSDLFLESKMPSLYDAFNEFSEASAKKTKRAQRAIPLAPSQVQTNHQKRGRTDQATREFNTVRQSVRRKPKTEDLLSAALLLVKGRTPAHLALETYDRWDGRNLIASACDAPLRTNLKSPDKAGRRWLQLAIARPTDVFASTTPSQVRVVNLKTQRVPTPAGVTCVTLDGLHTGSMFTFAADGSLAMDVDHVPQLTIFNFQSELRDRWTAPPLKPRETAAESNRVADLAREWTRDVAEGWPQVEAVVARLRTEYAHDRDAMVPDEADDAVEHFLFEARRGPDYLFAASTAVLLRSLGYDTRVRSGFYARPSQFDRVAQFTPVVAEDAHFWVEVLSSTGSRVSSEGESLPGVWVTVEPTPGFEVLYTPETLWARFTRALRTLGGALLANPVSVAATLLVAGVLYRVRRPLLDAGLFAWWSVRSRTVEAGNLARVTLRLFEWRAWVYRRGRPAGTSLGRWDALAAHRDFVGLASWALYGAGSPAPLEADVARRACARAIRSPLQTNRVAPSRDQRTDTPRTTNENA